MQRGLPLKPFAVIEPPVPMFEVRLGNGNDIEAQPILLLLMEQRERFKFDSEDPKDYGRYDYHYCTSFGANGVDLLWTPLIVNESTKELDAYWGKGRTYLGIHSGEWNPAAWEDKAAERRRCIEAEDARRAKAREYNRQRREKKAEEKGA